MHTELNHNSRRILAAIMQARQDGRCPPSIRDLRAITGLNHNNSIVCHLTRLQNLGLIKHGLRKHARTCVPTCRYVPADQLEKAHDQRNTA